MWQFAAKLTRILPAELAHNLTIKALRLGLAPVAEPVLLPTKIAGLAFDNPVGLAAGFDKNAEAFLGAFKLALVALKWEQLPLCHSRVIRVHVCSG